MPTKFTLTTDQIFNICKKGFAAAGLSEADAAIAARNHYVANSRGLDTHGLTRFGFYVNNMRKGTVKLDAEPKILQEFGGLAYYDADNGLGTVTASKIMDATIARAKEHGVAVSSVKNGSHFGCGAAYLLQAVEQDMIVMVISNTLRACMPYGGKEMIMGNSPWGIAFPGGKKHPRPIVLDMANVEATFGRCRQKVLAGEPAPLGWVLDANGNDSTDASAPLGNGGALKLFGGIKGYCISVMWELLSIALPGASNATEISAHMKDGVPDQLGYYMMVIDPSKLRTLGDFQNDVDDYVDMIKNCACADGIAEVYLPGEIENNKIEQRATAGVEIFEETLLECVQIYQELKLLPENATIEDLLASVE